MRKTRQRDLSKGTPGWGGVQTHKASQRISLPRKEMIPPTLVFTHHVRPESEFRALQQQWGARVGMGQGALCLHGEGAEGLLMGPESTDWAVGITASAAVPDTGQLQLCWRLSPLPLPGEALSASGLPLFLSSPHSSTASSSCASASPRRSCSSSPSITYSRWSRRCARGRASNGSSQILALTCRPASTSWKRDPASGRRGLERGRDPDWGTSQEGISLGPVLLGESATQLMALVYLTSSFLSKPAQHPLQWPLSARLYYAFTHRIITSSCVQGVIYYNHFTDGNTEAPKNEVPCPRSSIL